MTPTKFGTRPRVNAKEFGLRLREMREALGWNQRELAERMGITQAAVGNWEQGSRSPKFPEQVVKLAAVLGADVADLFVKAKPTLIPHERGRPRKPVDDAGEGS